LNDVPDIDNGEENYLNIISILSENTNCYKEIYDECKFNKPKIIPVLEKYKDKINIKIIGDFPSITLVTKI
tara:strand:- start:1725 stop:1937 length:213 start_codon:yes stop_codon:yes gene_type:complete